MQSLSHESKYAGKWCMIMSGRLEAIYQHELTLFSVGISNYTHHKVWDEISDGFPNCNAAAVDVCELISNFSLHFTGRMLTDPYGD